MLLQHRQIQRVESGEAHAQGGVGESSRAAERCHDEHAAVGCELGVCVGDQIRSKVGKLGLFVAAETWSVTDLVRASNEGIVKITSRLDVGHDPQPDRVRTPHDFRQQRRVQPAPVEESSMRLPPLVLFRVEKHCLDEIRMTGEDLRPFHIEISVIGDRPDEPAG